MIQTSNQNLEKQNRMIISLDQHIRNSGECVHCLKKSFEIFKSIVNESSLAISSIFVIEFCSLFEDKYLFK